MARIDSGLKGVSLLLVELASPYRALRSFDLLCNRVLTLSFYAFPIHLDHTQIQSIKTLLISHPTQQPTMSAWSGWFSGGSARNKNQPKEAIVGLRIQLNMLEKKEQHLNKKIDEEQNKARAMVSTNKRGASASKKASILSGRRD